MIQIIQDFLPLGVVILNVLSGVLLISLWLKNSLSQWVGKHAILLGFLVALGAICGSLFYSEVVGFPPCVLCWWQRMAIYPLLPLFLVALLEKDYGVFKYVIPLSVLGGIVALYHSYVQWGGSPFIPCDATASCSKLYVYAFGYVTIPTMSLSVLVAFLLLAWASKAYSQSRS